MIIRDLKMITIGRNLSFRLTLYEPTAQFFVLNFRSHLRAPGTWGARTYQFHSWSYRWWTVRTSRGGSREGRSRHGGGRTPTTQRQMGLRRVSQILPLFFLISHEINLLAPELFFLILAHSVYKMWIIQDTNKLELWNKLHFKERKNGEYTPCLKYSVPTFVE